MNYRIEFRELDLPMCLLVAALISTGFVMMSSASIEYASANYGSPFYHLIRHSIYLLLALVASAIFLFVPVSKWQEYSWLMLIIGFVLLVAVLIPGVGKVVNGSRRWLAIGPLTLQASEVAKICVLMYLAGYLVRRQQEVRSEWQGFLKPLAVLVVMVILLLAEPDFGSVVVTMGAALGMLFLSGVKFSQFMTVMALRFSAGVGMIASSPYRMQRLVTYLDPWADPYGSGYQLTQALIAFGRGEVFGAGLGNSVQKLFYLPEAHTDFVFAVISEELGLLGALFVISLFVTLITRVMLLGRKAEVQGEYFSAYLAYGLGLMLSAQIFINIGVSTGLLPTKGLTLPFLSYGGSSLIVCCSAMAILLRIDYELKKGIKKA